MSERHQPRSNVKNNPAAFRGTDVLLWWLVVHRTVKVTRLLRAVQPHSENFHCLAAETLVQDSKINHFEWIRSLLAYFPSFYWIVNHNKAKIFHKLALCPYTAKSLQLPEVTETKCHISENVR